MMDTMPELTYVALIFGLFVIPRMLARFRLPAAITALFLGVLAGVFLEQLDQDVTLKMMSLFGISSLFLFAGLDVDIQQLKDTYKVLIQHVVITILMLSSVSWMMWRFFDLPAQQAGLLALGLLTPSCGFIFDSLDTFGLSDDEKYWVKSKAVATEIVALVFMFFALQSESVKTLSISLIGMTLMVLFVPLLFRFFAKVIAPFAEGSEFAFLLMTAILCAVITRKLGAYYLVGAFFVGTAAHQFEKMLPAATAEKTIYAMRVFASFFIPFYFFKAGMEVQVADLSLEAFMYAALWLLLIVPLRVFVTALHRRLALKKPLREGKRVAYALLPTLVFGLVIAGLLRERFQVPRPIFGGAIIYTVVITMVPGFILKIRERFQSTDRRSEIGDRRHSTDSEAKTPSEA